MGEGAFQVMNYLLSQAREPSTWRGIVLIATACGLVLSPDQKEAIVAAGLFVAGLIGAAVPDAKRCSDPKTDQTK